MKEPSYKRVNYLLRLKKQIERKIIIEVLQKLNRHASIPINKYHYFGLGSVYFADFILLHKYLNINHMISIDSREEDEKRFLFNKPYKFIRFKILYSTELLEKDKYEYLDWDWNNKMIIWLDYDVQLSMNWADAFIISDFTTIAKKAKFYDIFITTIECWRNVPEIKNAYRYKNISKYLSLDESFFSNNENLEPEKSPIILNDFIRGCLKAGFGRYKRSDIDFIHLFNFAYEDTALMYTFGCIFVPKKELIEIKKEFKKLGVTYFGEKSKPEIIDCPLLTPYEKYTIDSSLKKEGDRVVFDSEAEQIGLTKKMIRKYIKYYKYYPQFFEAVY